MAELKRVAKRSLVFQNYKPEDASLGGRSAVSKLLQPERVEKEMHLRIEKMSRAFFSDNTKQPLKIIPKKPTIDIETKLQSVQERLKLRTRIAIVRLLQEKIHGVKHKVEAQVNGTAGELEEQSVSQSKNTIQIIQEEDERRMFLLQRKLQAVEENPAIKESLKFMEVDWVDELLQKDGRRSKKDGDVISGIAMLEKLPEELHKDDDEED